MLASDWPRCRRHWCACAGGAHRAGIRIRPVVRPSYARRPSAAALGGRCGRRWEAFQWVDILEADRQADVVVQLATDVEDDPVRLARLPLLPAVGGVVPLGAVADRARAAADPIAHGTVCGRSWSASTPRAGGCTVGARVARVLDGDAASDGVYAGSAASTSPPAKAGTTAAGRGARVIGILVAAGLDFG